MTRHHDRRLAGSMPWMLGLALILVPGVVFSAFAIVGTAVFIVAIFGPFLWAGWIVVGGDQWLWRRKVRRALAEAARERAGR